jgi:hypothetical protein
LLLGHSVSGDHILGWPIVTSDTDVVHLQAGGHLLNGTIDGRRLTPERLGLRTFVHYNHGMLTHVISAITSPLHRAVAPFLLEQGAAARPAASSSERPGGPS